MTEENVEWSIGETPTTGICKWEGGGKKYMLKFSAKSAKALREAVKMFNENKMSPSEFSRQMAEYWLGIKQSSCNT